MTQVWRAQEEHRKILDKLLLLNTTADKLIQARIQAEARLVVAVSSGNAPGIAAAKARLSIVRARQAVLRTKQQALLWSADFTATNFNSSVRHNIQRDLLIKNFELDEMKLAIFATPAQEIAPRYELQEPFRQRQSAGGQWTVKGLRGSCFATLEKRGQKWFVRMIADKS